MNQKITEEAIKAFEVIKKGGVILYPSDTIWGIGCDALQEKAVNKVYSIKERHSSKALIVLLSQRNELEKYVSNVPLIALELMDKINKPLTIIYPNAKNLPSNLIAEDGSIAIRISKCGFCQTLIKLMDRPLVSSSANISDEPTPLYFKQITSNIISSVDHIVNLQRHEVIEANPSTIIRFKNDFDFEIVRNTL
ncbi:MAG: L-threonylcarbamoyladenylate synthase [Bacteroidales bacterium]|jgi:L-threonylcarbamoyladenylate synthase|nr:threonylcarbamoyl-AMP synthase [Bacteroidales bacterium]